MGGDCHGLMAPLRGPAPGTMCVGNWAEIARLLCLGRATHVVRNCGSMMSRCPRFGELGDVRRLCFFLLRW